MAVLLTISLLCSLLAPVSQYESYNDTKEGVYILFPSRTLQLSNLQLNSYLTALNLLNAFLSTKDESLSAQGPFTIYKVRFINSSH